jgi:hypothetical protein
MLHRCQGNNVVLLGLRLLSRLRQLPGLPLLSGRFMLRNNGEEIVLSGRRVLPGWRVLQREYGKEVMLSRWLLLSRRCMLRIGQDE